MSWATMETEALVAEVMGTTVDSLGLAHQLHEEETVHRADAVAAVARAVEALRVQYPELVGRTLAALSGTPTVAAKQAVPPARLMSSLTILAEGLCGVSPEETTADMVALAAQMNVSVLLDFNGVKMFAAPGCSAESVVRTWRRAWARRREVADARVASKEPHYA